MSIPQWFAEDASCGPTNSMNGLMKHITHDRSSQQDKFTAERYGEGSSKAAFRTQKNIKQQDEYAQKFFQHPGQESSLPPDIYNFDQMNRGLETIVHDSQKNGDWAASFLKQSESTHHHIMPDHARSEFENFEVIYKDAQNQDKWATEFSQFHKLPANDVEIRPEEIAAFEQAFDDAKKSANWESEFKAQEQTWANEFKEQEGIGSGDDTKTELSDIASKLLVSIEGETNPKFKNSSFMNFMKKLSKQELSIEGNKVVEQKAPIPNANWASEFETQQQNNNNNWASEFNNKQIGSHSNWAQEFYGANTLDTPKHGEGSTLRAASNEFDSRWATEFQKAHNRINEDNSNASPALDEWMKDYKDYKEDSIDQTMEDLQSDWEKYRPINTGYSLDPPLHDIYEFHPNNPYLTTPNLLPETSTTKEQILADSILILEAKVQIDPNDSNAWYQLGTRQQENEQEPKAIAALRKAVALNPQILDAWMSLAVSYTNEYQRDDVYNVLESWFDHSHKYKQLLEQQRAKGIFVDPHSFFTDLFIQAALLNPGENLDPDVQVGLGILYNVSEEYNKAVDCFQTALSLRPNDYLLWNKLGATLANARESEKAVNAYFNALEINPLYVRARYNLAISFINMKEYREAAEHLLAALALQTGETNAITSDELNKDSSFHSVAGGVMSSNIWATLKACCKFLDRPDLENKCDIRDLNAFKQEFEF